MNDNSVGETPLWKKINIMEINLMYLHTEKETKTLIARKRSERHTFCCHIIWLESHNPQILSY